MVENGELGTGNWEQRTGNKLLLVLLLLVVIMFAAACSSESPEEEVSELALKLTEAAVPQPGSPADPLETPVSQNEMMATATQLAVELQETAVFVDAQEKQSELDVFATEEPVRRELATYGVLEGRITGLYKPVSLEQAAEGEYDFYQPSFAAHARDFVVAADITWNSASEDSGCGFVIRSSGDEEDLNQYVLGVSRSGNLLFTEQFSGEIDANQILEINVPGIDPQFNPNNGGTNRVAIVGRGQDFTIFSNGKLLSTITAQGGLEDGFVTFIAVNDTGGIRCDFNNAWLWEMN